MSEPAFGRSLRAATSSATPSEGLTSRASRADHGGDAPVAPGGSTVADVDVARFSDETECEKARQNQDHRQSEEHRSPHEASLQPAVANSVGQEERSSDFDSCRQGRSAAEGENDRRRDLKLCYWCHEPLPPLPDDASYVDEINHYIHDDCRDERDESNRRTDQLRAGIADGSIDCIPDPVRQAVLDRIKASGFCRRCPCLYDPDYGFQGYETHSFGDDDVDDYDVRNSVTDCDLCGGSGNYDPLPKLLELTEDKAAEAWISEELPRSSGPCDHWIGFPEAGWYYDALGYNRHGKADVRGVTLYNPDLMLAGVISWLEIADLFRPRVQASLF